MEIAIPLIAVGGMYVISNQQNDQSKKQVKFSFETSCVCRLVSQLIATLVPCYQISPPNYCKILYYMV